MTTRVLRVLRRAAVLAAATFIMCMVGVSASHAGTSAALIDCTSPPLSVPGNGVSGIDPGPVSPRTGDPFAADASVTAYEVYGLAGIMWVNYDMGCGPDALRDTSGAAAGAVADMILTFTVLAEATTNTLSRWALDPSTISLLDPLWRITQEAFSNRVFVGLYVLTCVIAGLLILSTSHRGNVRHSGNQAGWLILVMVGAICAVLWPAGAAPALDSVATSGVTVTGQSFTGSELPVADTMGALVQRNVLYETWRSGYFGRSSGETADKYGPDLFKASVLTRQEAAESAANPERAEEIKTAKNDEFNEIAAQIKEADPTAYEYLAGNKNIDRVAFAILGFLGWLVGKGYFFVAVLIVFYAMTIIRLAIALFPLVAVVGGLYAFRKIVLRIVDYVLTCMVAAFVFGAASVVFAAIVGGVLSPSTNTPPLLAALLMGVLSAAMWYVTKPFRALGLLGGKNVSWTLPRVPHHTGRGAGTEDTAPGSASSSGGGTPAEAVTIPATPVVVHVGQETTVHAVQPPTTSTAKALAGAAARGAVIGALTSGPAGATAGATRAAAASAAAQAASQGSQQRIYHPPTDGPTMPSNFPPDHALVDISSTATTGPAPNLYHAKKVPA